MLLSSIFIILISSFAGANTSLYQALDKNEGPKAQVVPAGNGSQTTIPEIARLLVYSRALLGAQFEALMASENETDFAISLGKNKIPQIMKKLREEGLLGEVKKIAKIFEIDPVHILGPILGENSFNGSIDQTLQNMFAKMFAPSDFEVMSKRMQLIADEASVRECLQMSVKNFWRWQCLLNQSNYLNSGSNRDFQKWLYQISHTGKGTFGIGQVQPFLLWSVNDVVVQKMNAHGYNYKTFSLTDMKTPFKIIFDNKQMLAYIAAFVKSSMDVYRSVAGMDISQNPGLTTTLYNLGDEYRRAYGFQHGRSQWPQVNYMGWYINYFEADIRQGLAE